MSKKSIFIVLSVVIIFVIGVVGYKLFQEKKREMLNATIAGLKDGRKYGVLKPTSSCIQGLPLKYPDCNNFTCSVSAQGFLVGCMKQSIQENYCESIPAPSDSKELVKWSIETCSGLNLSNTKCEDYIIKVPSECLKIQEGKSRSTMEIFKDGVNRGLEKAK